MPLGLNAWMSPFRFSPFRHPFSSGARRRRSGQGSDRFSCAGQSFRTLQEGSGETPSGNQVLSPPPSRTPPPTPLPSLSPPPVIATPIGATAPSVTRHTLSLRGMQNRIGHFTPRRLPPVPALVRLAADAAWPNRRAGGGRRVGGGRVREGGGRETWAPDGPLPPPSCISGNESGAGINDPFMSSDDVSLPHTLHPRGRPKKQEENSQIGGCHLCSFHLCSYLSHQRDRPIAAPRFAHRIARARIEPHAARLGP